MGKGTKTGVLDHATDLKTLSLQIIEDSPLPMATLEGPEHIIRHVNPAFCRMVDKNCEQLLGIPFAKTLPEGDEYVSLLDRVYRTGETETSVVEDNSGPHPIYWSYTAWPVSTAGQLLIGVTTHDTTEAELFRQKVTSMNEELVLSSVRQHELTETAEKWGYELEKRVAERTTELQHSHDLLLQETREKEQVTEQFYQSQKMEALGTLAGGIAHDFNNMLAVILGNAELLLDDLNGDSGEKRNVDQIITAAKRARDLVKQILMFSKKAERGRKAVPLIPLVKETYQLLRGTLPSTIHMEMDLPKKSHTILAEASQVQQILMNLATNASYAMRTKGGTMKVSLSTVRIEENSSKPDAQMRPGVYVKLAVQDTGAGMTDTVRRRVFEPFFTTKKAGRGTGMGLAVVYGIVKNLGGTITVESKQGSGSTFSVFFPHLDAPAVPKRKEKDRIHGGSERILLVDDEPSIVEMMSQTLERLGYSVTSVQSGEGALKMFLDEPSRFDLVITDQTIPDLTGLDLAKSILQARKDIPIILFTGYSEALSPDTAKAAGISEFIMKPVAKREMAETIRRALDNSDKTV